jgi:hypothetical protein
LTRCRDHSGARAADDAGEMTRFLRFYMTGNTWTRGADQWEAVRASSVGVFGFGLSILRKVFVFLFFVLVLLEIGND